MQASRYNGQILVAREAPSEGAVGFLVDKWEEMSGVDAVQTPSEVYQSLQAEGYDVAYHRVPVTDGTPPRVGLASPNSHQMLPIIQCWF